MKKIITTILITITLLTNSARADSYAIPGMWIGATSVTAFVAISTAASNSNGCSDDCDLGYFAAIGLGILGGLVGAGIGASIPRESKITFSPTIAPTKDGVNVGGNLAIRF